MAETRVLQGAPERLVPGWARELGADLIIAGPSRHLAKSEALDTILHDAPCSVLVLASEVAHSDASVAGSTHFAPAHH